MRASLKRVGGALRIDVDGESFLPLSFKSFRPTKENISECYRSGVRLFSILSTGGNCTYDIPYSLFGESWVGDGKYDMTAIDKQIDFFIENAPGCFLP